MRDKGSKMTAESSTSLRALYLDFNSYFASVEQQLQPALRGRPVGVVPVWAESTCCIAASIEAKRYGVRTGTLVRDARRMCPELILVLARHARYIEMHHALRAAVESCLHVVEVRSIDEMWCELQGRDCQPNHAIQLAEHIKQTISRQVGPFLRCSIGLAPNRYLAKVASDMHKPDGLVVLERKDLPHALFPLALRDLNGIGRAMHARLQQQGIHTVEALYQATPQALQHAWGSIDGRRMWARLRGEWEVSISSERSSISHSHVLPPAYRSPAGAFAVAHRLLQRAATRLRQAELVSGRLTIGVKLQARGVSARQWWQQESVLSPTSDTSVLLRAFEGLWCHYPADARLLPQAVSVGLTALAPYSSVTRPLFSHDHRALSTAIDQINLRYGKNTLVFGGAWQALAQDAPRIAFAHIPDLRLE